MLLTTGYHSSEASSEPQKGLKSPSEQKSLVSSLQGQRLSSKKELYEKECLTSFVMRTSLDVERQGSHAFLVAVVNLITFLANSLVISIENLNLHILSPSNNTSRNSSYECAKN